MNYLSTRDKSLKFSFKDIFLRGLAPGGGLFLPSEIRSYDKTDLENIKKEVLEAKKTFQKYKWPSIDVTRKSVEETAASIIKIHEIYLKNVR